MRSMRLAKTTAPPKRPPSWCSISPTVRVIRMASALTAPVPPEEFEQLTLNREPDPIRSP
jgi:hypothetical protein